MKNWLLKGKFISEFRGTKESRNILYFFTLLSSKSEFCSILSRKYRYHVFLNIFSLQTVFLAE